MKPGIFRSKGDFFVWFAILGLVWVLLWLSADILFAETNVYDCRVRSETTYVDHDSALVDYVRVGDTARVMAAYLRNGDINGDNAVNATDIITLVMYVFKHDSLPVLDSIPSIMVYTWDTTSSTGYKYRRLLLIAGDE